MKKVISLAILSFIAVFVLMADGCSSSSPSAAENAVNKASTNSVYVPHNNIELGNYNKRQAIADDPTTILWCTSAFPIPGSPMFTVPVVGKLTSANKRPIPTMLANTYYNTISNEQTQEIPGPDGMFGSSSDYRYGFTPAGVYVDFYNLQTFCTTEPTVFQQQNTKIVLKVDNNLAAAQIQAQAALKAGHPDQAAAILQQALGQ